MAFVLRFVLDALWKDRLPYVSFFLAVLLVARYTGTGPVLLTAGAGFVLADWYFIAPRHSLLIQDQANWVSTGVFFFLTIIVVVLSRRTRLALARERDANLRLREHVEALRESEERYASIVENCRDAILLTDSEGKVLAANREACRMFGRTEEELRRLDRHALIDPSDTLAAETAMAERTRSGKAQFELAFLRADGSRFTGEVSSAVFRDRHGVARNSSIIRDVTERRMAECERERLVDQLQAALRDVKTLSGLLPICSHCKRIRDDQGYWNQIEFYIRARSNADFTHSICPDCARKHYPDLYPDDQSKPA